VEEQERFARLESRVEHVRSDVTELKADVRALGAKFDAIKDALSEMQASPGVRQSLVDGHGRRTARRHGARIQTRSTVDARRRVAGIGP